jgi:hypothetical protein
MRGIRRREFIITLIGSGAAATAITWPRMARSQDRMRRIAVIIGSAENDPSVLPRVAALRQGLKGSAGSRDATFTSKTAGPAVIYSARKPGQPKSWR